MRLKYLLNFIWYENFLLSVLHWQSVNLSWFIACFHHTKSIRTDSVRMYVWRVYVNIIRLCEQFVRKLNNNLETRRQQKPNKSQVPNFPKW